jgi:anti-sigma regulatory factor (Ser/Thr protein kinase)
VTPALQARFQAAPPAVPSVRRFVRRHLRRLEWDGRHDDVVLAVSEAATNVVRHAYPGSPGWLSLTLRASAEADLEVVVSDDGVGFEHAGHAGRLGLPLIRRLAEDAEVTSEPGGGTTVRMRFARDPGAVPVPAAAAHRSRWRPRRSLNAGGPRERASRE